MSDFNELRDRAYNVRRAFPHIREAFPTYKGYEFIATVYLKFLKVL